MNILDSIQMIGKKRRVAQEETLLVRAAEIAKVGVVMSITEIIENGKAIKTRQTLLKAMDQVTRIAKRIERQEDPKFEEEAEGSQSDLLEKIGKLVVDGIWGAVKYIGNLVYGAVFKAVRYAIIPVFSIFSKVLVEVLGLAARAAIANPTLLAAAGVAALGYYLYRRYWGDDGEAERQKSVMPETQPKFRVGPAPEEMATGRKLQGAELYTAAVTESGLTDIISKGESGHNYSAANAKSSKGMKLVTGDYDLTSMTIAEVQELQRKGKVFAVGRYQVVPDTLAAAVKSLGVDTTKKFDPATQDYIFSGYLLQSKRPAVYDYITGKVADIEDSIVAAGVALAKEWRALANPLTGKTWGGDKDKRNKASVPWEDVKGALQKARRLYQSGMSAPVSTASAGPDFIVPTSGVLTSPFGTRVFNGKSESHPGIDIAGADGTPILAAQAGKVVTAGPAGGYGQLVQVDHGSGVQTLYGHNRKVLVAPGDTVVKGQRIAEMGSTGLSTGTHLHFEIRDGGKAVDPIVYVPQLAVQKQAKVTAGADGTQVARSSAPGYSSKEFVRLDESHYKVVELG